jgi:hypothetical protein
MFSSGTHYLFLEDEDQVFDADSLGPVGAVFAHGGTMAYHRMREWLQQGRPSVMLLNSGGVTQAFASLHNAVVRSSTSNIHQILEMCEITGVERWTKNFGLAEALMMTELKKRAPFLIKKSIVSVDILKDNAEEVLQVVTGCFANSSGRLAELGLGTAEAHAILRAWRHHLILYRSAVKQREAADRYFAIQTILLFLTSFAAAVKTEFVLENAQEWENSLYVLVIALPILTGLVSTWMQQQRNLVKWRVLWASAMRIVVQIYKFRARVLEYDTEATHSPQNAEGEEDAATSQAEPGRRARVLFVKHIQDIFATVLEGEMSAEPLDVNMTQQDSERGVPVDETQLREHVLQNLLHISEPSRGCLDLCSCMRRRPSRPAPRMVQSAELNGEEVREDTKDIFCIVEEDDFKSSISIESYIEHRMKPIMLYFGRVSPQLAQRLRVLQALSAIFNVAVVALALPQGVNLGHWLTLFVSLKVLIMNVIEYAAYGVQLAALNTGTKDLQNLLTWWESLSVIDRRTRQAKTRAVATLEQAMLKAFTARTGEVASVFQSVVTSRDDNDSDKEKDNKNNESQGGAKKE